MTTGDLRLTRGIVVPAAELGWRFSRSSGPGGQGVNTTDSRVELSWDVAASRALSPGQRDRLLAALAGRLVDGVVTVRAQEHRSQLRNREAAAERLAALVRDALRTTKARRPTRPTRGSQRRRLEAKKQRGETKALRRPPE